MLERCLYTLSVQTRAADEVIIVDNGSTDDSVAVAERFGARVISESLPGITAAASAGYDAASGDIIARCDADSRLPADWLEHIERELDAHPEAVAITGPGKFYDIKPPTRWLASLVYMRSYFFSMRGALANAPVFGSNLGLRRSFWASIRDEVPRDIPELHDDMDMSYRVGPAERVIYDRSLIVGISGRPLHSVQAVSRRLRMAKVTADQHPEHNPAQRWAARLAARRERST